MSRAGEPTVEASAGARFRRMSVGVLCLYAVLVALLRGEFWPFSIFPMFARAVAAGRGSWCATWVRTAWWRLRALSRESKTLLAPCERAQRRELWPKLPQVTPSHRLAARG